MYKRRYGLYGTAASLGYYAGKRLKQWRASAPATKKADKRQDAELSNLRRRVNRLAKETKHADIDSTAADTELNTTEVAPTYISGIAQGDESTEREGLEINLKKVDFRYQINSKGGGDEQHVRIVLFFDKAAHGNAANTTPSGFANVVTTDVMEVTTSASFQCLANYNHETHGSRYNIIYDRVHRFSDVQGLESGVFNFTKTWKAKKIHYTGTSASQASCGPNALYMWAYGNVAAGATAPDMRFTIRLTYTD